jgi:signal transduction histidine kinase
MRQQTPMSRFGVYLISILLLLGVAVGLIWTVMRPPMPDLRALSVFMGLTGLGSAVIGFLAVQMGWWRRLGSLTLAFTLGYVVAGVLTLLNVWVTAQLMFINQHDLALGLILLIFASGVSAAFGYFLSGAITQKLKDLAFGAGKISQGDFSTRVPVEGRDEVAHLSAAFNEMAMQLEKMSEESKALDEARRNLVAWASHDLRTPLASLRAMIDALADGVAADPDTAARYLRQSQTEITRMASLISDLFDLAQLDAGHMPFEYESSSLGDLISDTLAAFTARAQVQSITLTGSAGTGVDPVMMAPDKISRVLQNLVDNALRYTPTDGTITISAARDGENVHVTVRDTGSGISAEDLPHVFDRFYRGEKSRSRAGGGAGLGLAIARRVVQAHGGEMWVDTTSGQGTSMHFTLPKERKELGNEANISGLFAGGGTVGMQSSGEHARSGGR